MPGMRRSASPPGRDAHGRPTWLGLRDGQSPGRQGLPLQPLHGRPPRLGPRRFGRNAASAARHACLPRRRALSPGLPGSGAHAPSPVQRRLPRPRTRAVPSRATRPRDETSRKLRGPAPTVDPPGPPGLTSADAAAQATAPSISGVQPAADVTLVKDETVPADSVAMPLSPTSPYAQTEAGSPSPLASAAAPTVGTAAGPAAPLSGPPMATDASAPRFGAGSATTPSSGGSAGPTAPLAVAAPVNVQGDAILPISEAPTLSGPGFGMAAAPSSPQSSAPAPTAPPGRRWVPNAAGWTPQDPPPFRGSRRKRPGLPSGLVPQGLRHREALVLRQGLRLRQGPRY